jgi:hypothetical protein
MSEIPGGKVFIQEAAKMFAGALIMTVCAFGQFSASANTQSSTAATSLPPVGIGSTETAQVVLTNTASAASTGTSTASPNSAVAPSCTGSVAFYNASGAIVGTATSFTLTSGEISEVSIPYASTASTSVRELIRAVVSLTTTFPAPAPCALSYSLATFDTATGATHAIITGAGISGIATPVFGRF